jgi:sugar O-acyltransferase (sialic acid O-acetyltransferase NeuD family)
MSIDLIYLIGAGGHGKVVLDAMLSSGLAPGALRVVDENQARQDDAILGVSIIVPPADRKGASFHVAIGDAANRKRIQRDWRAAGATPLTVIHPAAIVSSFARLGEGALLAALAVVAPSARIGEGVIINHGAIVDHDCLVGAFSHIAPHATLGGAVQVGDGVLIGAAATILPGVKVGDGAVVGAGAVVLKDVPSGATVMGVPARKDI